MRLLDLFCGAGGAGVGYARAGFDVFGVDISPQKNYPFPMLVDDALSFLSSYDNVVRDFDVIHASPPCQRFSRVAKLRGSADRHPDLITPTRMLLKETGLPYIIENVAGAPLEEPIMLCGSMFPELRILRHRLFECSPRLPEPEMKCAHKGRVGHASIRDENGKRGHANLDEFEYITVAGHGYLASDGRIAMGIPWMTRDELSEAIPPAFTEYIGRQMMSHLLVF